jgi:hypothetical protein
MWGYRWAAELRVRVNGAFESEPPAWVLQYGKEQSKRVTTAEIPALTTTRLNRR